MKFRKRFEGVCFDTVNIPLGGRIGNAFFYEAYLHGLFTTLL